MWTSKDYCELKETRYPKLRNLALFYVWEDARVWAHWNQSFGMQPSYLGPVSRVSTSWVSSGLTIGNGCSLMAARGQVFLPSWVSWGSPAHRLWWLEFLATVTSFWFHPDMTGNIPFLICLLSVFSARDAWVLTARWKNWGEERSYYKY